MSPRFTVDLTELAESVIWMTRFQERLHGRLEHLDDVVATLHGTWVGAAAEAHGDAHRQWTQGAQAMHDALAEMAAAAQHAHAVYGRAAEVNATMWAGLP